MVLDSEVEKLGAVRDDTGDTVPPAGRDEQTRIREELGNFPSGIDGEATDDTTGSTLPANAVPDGVETVVQAKHDNGSRIKIGLTASPTVELSAGQSATFRVTDTSNIHIVAKSGGDGVSFSAEGN